MALRITVAGKGGSGKSTIAGTLCRVLAERQHRVLALDADTVAGLALAVGVEPSDAWPLAAAVRRKEGQTAVMAGTPEQVVERVSVAGPGGVRFLQSGKPAAKLDSDQRGAAAAFLELVRTFDQPGWTVVTDLAAGTRQAFFGWTGTSDTVLLVVRPGASSALTARRLGRLREAAGKDLRLAVVGSGVRTGDDRAFVRERAEELGVPCLGMVPHDAAVDEAARLGVAPFDHAPDGPAVGAVRELADELTAAPGVAEYGAAATSEEPS